MIIRYFKDYINSLNEGLIKTHDPQVVLNTTLNRLVNFNNISGELVKSNSNDKILIEINNLKNLTFKELNVIFDILSQNIINLGGFFISIIEIENLHKMKNYIKTDLYNIISNKNYYNKVKITFESKFEKTEELFDKLYHLSIKEYESDILKYGLQPKEKSKLTLHPDRIYLCSSKKDCEKLINQMKLYYDMEKDRNMYSLGNKKYKKDTDPVIFEIDNSDGLELYKDPNFIGGYFTIDNILPDKISKV